ncbi:DNA-binding transcriptional LysR family regulator [Sulfitobacter undariae]|uniref:DNA-binding transcriptional LysR family regulator n=1 Tax=Sulfitobacter undariae TaxID=1563671 RepID=A0A7W6E9D2_9RHOB|nr:LysR family transcriptional regulator [Sulfitobacter undariae]MBB3995846.1 DNA-binding transcriptional LysR family regulator [Sulfitobacter undariae]
MNTRFLETFIRVASLGSFRAAASQLNVSQATVSSRISALETEFDTQLFDREHHEIRLTAAGSLMLEKAERVLIAEKSLRETMNIVTVGAGRIRLGLVSSVVHTWLGELIAEIASAFPKLELELTVEPTSNLASQFERGGLDILITTDEINAERVCSMPLAPLELGWFTSETLARSLPKRPLEIHDIAHLPLITFTRRSRPYLSTLELFNSRDLQPPVLHSVTSLAAIVRLTERGLGVATLPCGFDMGKGTLVRLDLDARLPDLPLYCLWHKTSDADLYGAISALAASCAEAHLVLPPA